MTSSIRKDNHNPLFFKPHFSGITFDLSRKNIWKKRVYNQIIKSSHVLQPIFFFNEISCLLSCHTDDMNFGAATATQIGWLRYKRQELELWNQSRLKEDSQNLRNRASSNPPWGTQSSTFCCFCAPLPLPVSTWIPVSAPQTELSTERNKNCFRLP